MRNGGKSDWVTNRIAVEMSLTQLDRSWHNKFNKYPGRKPHAWTLVTAPPHLATRCNSKAPWSTSHRCTGSKSDTSLPWCAFK